MKTALVLSGGGARGAYEVGVWKALNELDIHCDIVTGVSIGSINGALYCQGTLDNAIELWKNINYNTVFDSEIIPETKKELRKIYFTSAKKGGDEPKNLKSNLIKCLDIDKIYSSPIDFGLITVRYPKLKQVELTKSKIDGDKFVDYLIASSTIFPVFKIKEIDENKYLDGGYAESIPIGLARKMGAEKFIVVNISVKDQRYKPNKKEKNIIYIKSKNNLGSPIVFDSKVAKRNINYGYNDTMKVYKKFYGKKYTFKDKKFQKCIMYNTFDKYINVLEYLGKAYEIDDNKIYDVEKYNKIIFEKVKDIKFDEKIRLKDLSTKSERIAFIYNRLLEKKVVRQDKKKRILNIEYRCAYYLYEISKCIH